MSDINVQITQHQINVSMRRVPVSSGSSGDMLASVYDPNSVQGDAFDMDNMVAGATNDILTTGAQNIDGDKTFNYEIIGTQRSLAGINSINYAAVISVDFSAGDLHNVGNVTGNMTINTTNVSNGQTGVIAFTVDSTGGYTLASGTGTWKMYDDSPYDIPDCNVADTTYHIFYMIINNIIYYSIQAAT